MSAPDLPADKVTMSGGARTLVFGDSGELKPGQLPLVPDSKDALLIEALRTVERMSGLLNELSIELGVIWDDHFENLSTLLRRRFSDCSGVHLFIAAHNLGLDLPEDLQGRTEGEG